MTMPLRVEEPPAGKTEGQWAVEYLREREAKCPHCGYNLHKLSEPRCPECGKEIKLQVGLSEPYMTAWLASVLPWCANMGLGAFMLAQIIVERSMPFVSEGVVFYVMRTALGVWGISVVVAPVLVIQRRQFMRLIRWRQWLFAWLTWALTVGAFMVLVRTIW